MVASKKQAKRFIKWQGQFSKKLKAVKEENITRYLKEYESFKEVREREEEHFLKQLNFGEEEYELLSFHQQIYVQYSSFLFLNQDRILISIDWKNQKNILEVNKNINSIQSCDEGIFKILIFQINEYMNQQNQMVDCNICYCTYKEEECYTLPNCLHQFCKACLSEQLKTKIEAQQIDLSDFKCPQCGLLFNPEIIENFLSPNLFQKYCDFALQFNKIMGLEDHELLTNCLNEKCIEKFIIWKDAEYMQCPSCKMKFCRKCQLDYHADKGVSCEQQKKLLRDSFYMEMKKNLQVCKCPKCNNMCEKISGCNFMYCRCKTNFCFLCDVELTEENHFKHWQNDDPFKSPCRIWYNGTWVDPDKVPKVEPIKEEKIVQVIPIEEKENKIPCPNCGTKKKDESQLVFFDQVIQCQSNKCQNQAFCIFCQKQLHVYDISSHFNQQTLFCIFK